ncbi:transcription factor GTE4-like [Humulus lupulus]|uniref:transcription factor GTE4-like n=1 Tax=Humulus lupulus TaxID=3486 RepID=UPI002B4142E4|nr:transcription factor GTE4-like [Humulus lupulus]
MRVNSEVGSVGHRDSRSVRGAENSHGVGDFGEKKKTHKGNQHGQGGGGGSSSSNKKLKSSSKGGKRDDHEVRFGQSKDKYSSHLFKSCGNLLEKLMKHKFGWVFNVPVDVKGLGLLDYNSIIKHPMDLGTVKTRLNKTLYKSPLEFAEDVRLTFNNAMLYNPKGQDVHSMAEQLLKIFEDKWAGIEKEFNRNREDEIDDADEEEDDDDDGDGDGDMDLPRPWGPTRTRPAPSIHSAPAMRSLDRAESVTKPVDPNLVTTPVLKKPKAMDAHKRDMTYEEKQMLSTSLQNLPSEKLDNVVQIIKKRTPGLSQQEDEIEVDIASLEAETLWELDRFVTSYKKSLMSTNKRKAEVVFQSRPNDTGHGVGKRNIAPSAVEIRKGFITDSDNDGNSANGSH